MNTLFLELWNNFILKIGPIPTDDGVGKEVITQMTANMETNKVFYTDSNGRDFIERVTPLTIEFLIQYNYSTGNSGWWSLSVYQ